MTSSAPGVRVARFGAFELDVQTGELRKSGARIRLQDQPFRLLTALLERPGEIVTREELRGQLWPGDTFVDFDHGLNTMVRKLRAALDDSAETPRFIETLARRGYRFLGPVEWTSQVPAGTPSRRSATVALLAAGIVAASIIAIVLFRKTPSTAQPVRTLAVLPFGNSDPATQYVSDGVAEMLIDELSSSPALRGTARTSAFRYREPPLDLRKIGSELGVSQIITGEYAQTGDQFDVRLELIETRDAAQVWASRYRGPLTDFGAVQRRIAADAAFRLGVTPPDERHARRSSPAYDLYLRGRSLWQSRSRESLLKAIEHFDRATQIDPEFGLAYAGLATAYGALVGISLIPGSEAELEEKARAAAEKALALDPTLAEAYASLGGGKTSYFFDFEGAERDFRRAIELNPSYATARQWYAGHLWTTGRMTEARAQVDLAHQLDPFSFNAIYFLCWQRHIERQYEEAIAIGHRASTHFPFIRGWNCLERSYIMLGRYDQAIETIRVRNPEMANELLTALKTGGVEAYWKQRAGQPPADQLYDRARIHTAIGDHDEAFRLLGEAASRRCCKITWFHTDPAFDALRGDPRFDELA
ncbi:MAG TPA: winged helix-turn-helix domain-containing protein, partial [Thermoanaerobaculia bacterium]|nr:winged helix-turn-helix domain-containing protein [Thermoanaerobaculia bacterium]